MICLKDFVGPYYGCNSTVPQSGMYLTQLPGIEFEEIDQIADSDQITWSGVWDDLQATAIDTFREDIIEEFGKRYQLKQITQTLDLGKQIDINSLTSTASNIQNGLLIETLGVNDQFACSNMMNIYIQSVNFYCINSGTTSFTVNFIDADLGNTELSIITQGIQGWNNVWVDTSFVANRLRIVVDANTNFVTLNISDFNLDNYGGGSYWNNNSLYYDFGYSCQSRIRGNQYNTTTQTDITTNTNTFGLSVIMSSKCNWNSIVCNNKRHFASAWQHCLAIEFLNYRINSSRLNKFTTINLEKAIKLQSLYSMKYRGGVDEKTGLSYPGKLQNAITSIVINDNDCCIKKNGYLIFREQLP